MTAKAIPPVRLGNVVIPIKTLPDGRFRFSYKQLGKRKFVTLPDLAEIKRRALSKARELLTGAPRFEDLEPWQIEACYAVVGLGVTAQQIREAVDLAEKASKSTSPIIDSVIDEFLEVKKRAEGRSTRHLDGLKSDLGHLKTRFTGVRMDAITAPDLEAFWSARPISARRHNNLRERAVSVWRWARLRGYINEAITTPERTSKIKIGDKTIGILAPEELDTIWREVRDIYRPWLAISAWSGVRMQEMFPPTKSDKSPLDWSDFDWGRKLIIVRPETSKTGKRRIVPICASLQSALTDLRKPSGRIGPVNPPTSKETKRLGLAISRAWPQNCLRHSYGTYRAALVQNLGQVSLEMGNSIAVCQAHYHMAVTQDVAEMWFNVR